MKVSYNELQGLCRKAFSGVGFEEGDAADAADMVAWMQCHGLHGVSSSTGAWTTCSRSLTRHGPE